MDSPLITLTTDFGTRDPFAAAMKGVIWSIHPTARVVDLTHEIGPQNVREAALFLTQIVPYFPAGTIHVVVVDPDVGTDRRLLCVRVHEQFLLAPDNGVLSWVARGATTLERIELTERRFWRSVVSATFHGRDILAPVAAHLAIGVLPRALGRVVHDWVEMTWPASRRGSDGLDAEILAVDHFGNLISSATQADAESLGGPAISVDCAGRDVGRLVRTYSDVPDGQLLALIGSSGFVEIARRSGSAADTLGCSVGALVRLKVRPAE